VSRYKTPLGYVFPAFFGLAYLPCASLHAQTLQEAVAEAISTNPTILAAQEEQSTFEEQTKQAFAGYLPVVNLTAARGEEWTNSLTTRNAGNKNLNLTRTELGLTVSQMLFDGMDTKYQVEKAEAQHLSSTGRRINTEETMTMTVVGAYLDTLRETEILELQDQNITLHQEILDKVREMTKIGAGTEVDIKQSESRFALVASERESSLGLKLDAETRYLNTVGTKSEGLTRPVLKEHLLPSSLQKATEIAITNHPSLAVSQADIDAAIAEKKGASADFWPTISLELDASSTNHTSGTATYTNSASAMLELSYNLFNGGSDASKKRESIKNVSKSIEKLEEATRKVKESVATAWNQLQTSRKRIRHIEKHVSVARKVAKSYHDQFVMGSRSLLEVLDSESELHTAKKSLITEQFQFMRGTLQLLSAMGVLHKTITLPKQDIMQSIASKADVLRANSMILSQQNNAENLPPLETMIPDIVEPEKPSATPPTPQKSAPDNGSGLLPDLLELFDLTSEDSRNSTPDMFEYLPEELSENAEDPIDETSALDYLLNIEKPLT
jgi:outer membrane protein, adhesin transport system